MAHTIRVKPKRAKDAQPFDLTVTDNGQSLADAIDHVKKYCPNVEVIDPQPESPKPPQPAGQATPPKPAPPADANKTA